MKRAVSIVIVLLVVGAVAVGSWWYLSQNPAVWSSVQSEFEKAIDELGLKPEVETQGLFASGFVEAEVAFVTAEQGGRVVALYAGEGDKVSEGEVLLELDDSLLLAQVEMAEAELAVAEAMLALVKAGAREESLIYAEAQVAQAEAVRDAASMAWADAQMMLESPQDLDLAITAAQTQLHVLGHQAEQAEALANSAQVGRSLSEEIVSRLEDVAQFLPPDKLSSARHEQALVTYQSWAAWTGVEQAEVALTGAERYLAELYRQRANPLDLEAQVNAAKAQYEVSSAAVELAQAQVEGLKIGATPEQIAAADAQVEVARSALASLQVHLGKLSLKAPISGLVLERTVHVGEVAMPGAPLLTIADLGRVSLTIYVPEDQVGNVQLGQRTSVKVDAYPGRVFTGSVTFVSSQAEFTPKNVQTKEERVSMVFAVKVEMSNPDHALKPGMPADAVLSGTAR
jgi:multidrug efflux pump subunit AcrA (membrane-fusion protein)